MAALENRFAEGLFVPGVVIHQRNGTLLAGKFAVIKLVVFVIEQANPAIDEMEAADLFLQRDELISCLAVASDGKADDREFDAHLSGEEIRDSR